MRKSPSPKQSRHLSSRPTPEKIALFRTLPLLTTGQVACLFDISHRTIAKWADAKVIPCERLPLTSSNKPTALDQYGSDRRFRRTDVLRFARKNGLSMAYPLVEPSAMLYRPNSELVNVLRDEMRGIGVVLVAHTLTEAALLLERQLPRAVIVDQAMCKPDEATELGRLIAAKEQPWFQLIEAALLLTNKLTDSQVVCWQEAGYKQVFHGEKLAPVLDWVQQLISPVREMSILAELPAD